MIQVPFYKIMDQQHLPFQKLQASWKPNNTMASPNSDRHVSNPASSQVDDKDWPTTGIAYPGEHDVMLGRGGESNYHAGNLTFRGFIAEHKIRYQNARKQEKPIIALEVVMAWRELSPPGRFLARIDPSRADSLWEDVGDDQACKRAGRTLGEKTSSNKATEKKRGRVNSNTSDMQPFADQVGSAYVARVDTESRQVRAGDDFFTSQLVFTNGRTVHTHKNEMKSSPRTQGTLDLIASFNSQNCNLMSNSSTATQRDEKLMESNKKRKLAHPSPAPPSPDSSVSSWEDKLYEVSSQLFGGEEDKLVPYFDDDESRPAATAPSGPSDIPTAEFLTRTVFSDW